jgi:hypothetical protein
MVKERRLLRVCLLFLLCVAGTGVALGQGSQDEVDDSEFGPVVRAYLGYLRNEQEVVDDRASRHEINRSYYLRNSNRIRALRQMALRIARETDKDYLPELEAAARDELGNLFEHPPKPASLSVGEVYNNTFRFLGAVRAGDIFYIFARLDPYEQAELLKREKAAPQLDASAPSPAADSGQATTRPRRVGSP